jgi:sulfonate transport system ATP-binding protein
MLDPTTAQSGRLLIDNVHKSFAGVEGELPVLRGITLDIQAGEFVSIVGGSGCGKSTLLRAVAGIEGIDSGRLLLDGSPIVRPGIDRGLVFQEHRLMPWLTVAENVAFGLKTRSDSERKADVSHYIGLVGLQGFERTYPHQLSGGMAQRAAIARALINRPGMLLMDEPFGALDAFTRIQLQEEVLRIWRTAGTTVLLVTHDIEEAVFLSDRIAIMSNRPGTLRKVVTVDLPRPRDRTTDAFTRLRALVHREFFAVRESVEDYHI